MAELCLDPNITIHTLEPIRMIVVHTVQDIKQSAFGVDAAPTESISASKITFGHTHSDVLFAKRHPNDR